MVPPEVRLPFSKRDFFSPYSGRFLGNCKTTQKVAPSTLHPASCSDRWCPVLGPTMMKPEELGSLQSLLRHRDTCSVCVSVFLCSLSAHVTPITPRQDTAEPSALTHEQSQGLL